MLYAVLLGSLKVFLVCADGTHWTVVDEEISTCRAWWETLEMEEEPSSVAVTVQMEMAKTMETFGID